MNTTQPQVIGVAFGNPWAYTTFSGYSRYLFGAVDKIGALAGTLSSKIIRPTDVLGGCVNFSAMLHGKKPNISAHWLWNPDTIEKLSQRLGNKLAAFPKGVPVLQVGTHAYPVDAKREYYCITDMTIKQAVMAEQFRIKHLTGSEIINAIQVQKQMFDSYEKIFVLCEWTRLSVIQDYEQSPEKVIVIGAGANMHPVEPDPQKYSSHEILFVGFDWIRKGGPLLLEVFELVRGRIPDAVLNIVGANPSVLMPGVNVIGPLQKSDPEQMSKLESLYRRANCFCLLPEFDPFPNVLLEAGITATPVVSLKNGSRADAVRDGVTGILVERAKAAEIAEALVYILSNADVAEKMGKAAKKFTSENYTWNSIAKKLINHIYEPGGVLQNGCISNNRQLEYL